MITKPLTTFQAAKLCGVFHTTVINWVNKGRLKASHTPGGHRRIEAHDLRAFLKEKGSPVPMKLGGAITDKDMMDCVETLGLVTRKGLVKMIEAQRRGKP